MSAVFFKSAAHQFKRTLIANRIIRRIQSTHTLEITMKHIMVVPTTIALMAASILTAAAQTPANAASSEQTLIPGRITSGGYGGPVQQLSVVNGNTVLFTGAEGGGIVNHSFVLGAAGYGLATQNVRNPGATLRDSKGRAPVVEMGYGGITLGYVSQPMKVVHLAVQTLIGGGGLTYDTQDIAGMRPEDAPADAFFVLEPSMRGEVNVTRILRIDVGAGYRFVSGASLDGMRDNDLRGASASLSFKLGRF
jgi:hypothetical protein